MDHQDLLVKMERKGHLAYLEDKASLEYLESLVKKVRREK